MGKAFFPEPKTTCMWMGLTCLPPPRLVEKGKGNWEDEKERNWFGSTPETLSLSLSLLKRAREKTLVRRTADKAAARLG